MADRSDERDLVTRRDFIGILNFAGGREKNSGTVYVPWGNGLISYTPTFSPASCCLSFAGTSFRLTSPVSPVPFGQNKTLNGFAAAAASLALFFN